MRATRSLRTRASSPASIARTTAGPIEVVIFSRDLDYEGVPAVLIAVIDITERKEAEARIAHMAHHDALTDLPNRVLFRLRMTEALAQRCRTDSLVGALCIDLDNFKLVNDTLGHPIGDRLLQDVAERIERVMRRRDTAARLGGDEFAVLVPDLKSPEELAVLAEKLIEVVSEPYLIEGHLVTVGTTVGIAVAPSDGEDADRLLRNADLALYRAKADGKSTFRFFETEMDAAGAGAPSARDRPAERARRRASWRCTISRSSSSSTGDDPRLRGAVALAAPHSAATSRRPSSFRWPRKPDSSRRSATTCCARLRRRHRMARRTSTLPSTCRRCSSASAMCS